VNKLNKDQKGELDTELMEIQFKYQYDKKDFCGILSFLFSIEDLVSNDHFIDKYLHMFSSLDWNRIVYSRKDDQEFIEKYWHLIDHDRYFRELQRFSLNDIKLVVQKGYVHELKCESWSSILQKVGEDGQLNELYELCGNHVIFSCSQYCGKLQGYGVNMYPTMIPKFEQISDAAIIKILEGKSFGWISPCGSYDERNFEDQVVFDLVRELTGYTYDDKQNNYYANLEKSLAFVRVVHNNAFKVKDDNRKYSLNTKPLFNKMYDYIENIRMRLEKLWAELILINEKDVRNGKVKLGIVI